MLGQLRSAGRHLLARLHDRSAHVLRRLQGRVLILGYHRVLPASAVREQFVQPGMYVRPEVFEDHVRFLREHFQVISFSEFLDRQRRGTWQPDARYCLITFDDGWLDNYVHAYPILRRCALPATIFVSTALIGSEEWLWSDKLAWLLSRSTRDAARVRRESRYSWISCLRATPTSTQIDSAIEACKRLPDHEVADLILDLAVRLGVEVPKQRRFLDWTHVEEMSQADIAFGSHGATHRRLPGLSALELRAEVAGSLRALQTRAVNWIPVFCYPNGDHDDTVVDHVGAAGYQAAVSTVSGAEAWEDTDLFRLRRVCLHDDVSSTISLLAFHLSRVGHL